MTEKDIEQLLNENNEREKVRATVHSTHKEKYKFTTPKMIQFRVTRKIKKSPQKFTMLNTFF